MKLIEADKVEQAIKDYWKAQVDRAPIPKSIEEYNAYVNCLDAILERNDGLLKAIDELPSAQSDTTTHDSIPAETDKNDEDRTSGDCISRQAAIDALLGITAMRNTIPLDSAIFNIKKLPSVQPERKDAVEKAVAVEAISDELMSRFDISATYAYEVTEKAMNRIEAMAKELERGE